MNRQEIVGHSGVGPPGARSWYVCKYCRKVYTDSGAFWEHKKTEHWAELVEEKKKRARIENAHDSINSNFDRQGADGVDTDRVGNKYGRFHDQRGVPSVIGRSSGGLQGSGPCDSPNLRQLALPAAIGGHATTKRLSVVNNNENDCRDLKLYSPEDAQLRLQEFPVGGKFTPQQIKQMGLGPKRLTGTIKVHYGVQCTPEQVDAACGTDRNIGSQVTKGIQTHVRTKSSACQWRPLPEDEMVDSRQTQTEKAATAELDTQTETYRMMSHGIQTEVPVTLYRETQTENAVTYAQGMQTETAVTKSLDTQTDVTETVSFETQTEITKTVYQESQTDVTVTKSMETQTDESMKISAMDTKEVFSQEIQTEDVFRLILKSILTESSCQTDVEVLNKSIALENDIMDDYEGDWEIESETVVGTEDKTTFAEISTQTDEPVAETAKWLLKGMELMPIVGGNSSDKGPLDGAQVGTVSTCSTVALYNHLQVRPPEFAQTEDSGNAAKEANTAGSKSAASKRRFSSKRRFLRKLFRKSSNMPRLTRISTTESGERTEDDEEIEDIPIVPIYSSIKFATGTWHFARRNFWKPVSKYHSLRKRSFASGTSNPDPEVNKNAGASSKKSEDETLPHSSATVDKEGNVTLPVVQSEFGCWICPKQFTSVEDLEIHIKYVHLLFGLKLFGCSICRGSYTSTAALRKHIAVSHHLTGTGNQAALRKFRYFCHMCCKPVRYSSFVHHLRTQHAEETGQGNGKGRDKTVSPTKTGSGATGRGRACEEGTKNISCPNCTEAFTTRRRLYAHRKKFHKEEAAPFQCSLCTKSYSTDHNLNRHVKNIHRRRGAKKPAARKDENEQEIGAKAERIATKAEKKEVKESSKDSIPGTSKSGSNPKTPQTLYQCNKCEFRSPSKSGVKIHRKKAHPKEAASISAPTRESAGRRNRTSYKKGMYTFGGDSSESEVWLD